MTTPTYTDQEILDSIRAAIVVVLTGAQSYVTGLGMSVTKADLDKLQRLETLYTKRVTRRSGGSRASIRFGRPGL